jgi:hypothetical protein
MLSRYKFFFLKASHTGIMVKGIASRDFGVLFLFIWIDMKFLIGPDQVYFSF